MKDTLGQDVKARTGPKAIDKAGLRDILPEFNPDVSTSSQFPHVAITVLKSPPMWGDPAKIREQDSTSRAALACKHEFGRMRHTQHPWVRLTGAVHVTWKWNQ